MFGKKNDYVNEYFYISFHLFEIPAELLVTVVCSRKWISAKFSKSSLENKKTAKYLVLTILLNNYSVT